MSTILVVGSANVDLVVTSKKLPLPGETLLGAAFSSHLGGKGANQAVAAARAGAKVRMLARVGQDAFGDRLLDGLTAEGIDTTSVLRVAAASGVALIVTTGGSNMIVVAPGANDLLTEDAVRNEYFDGIQCVLAQLEIPLETVQRTAALSRERGAVFILDPAPARSLPDALLGNVDWLTPNESEARILLGVSEQKVDGVAAAREFRRRGVPGVIIKLGDRGIVLCHGENDPITLPALKVSAVDTTAAGDVFNGAFAAALTHGKNPVDAAKFAIAAAGISVRRLGAQSSIPRREEIDAAATF